MKVFVLDTNKQPLAPCHPARARQLLGKGKAAVYRRYPFTIILKREVKEADTQPSWSTEGRRPFRLKIDPGSKKTGIAIVNDSTGEVIFAAEVQHRGQQIKSALDSRRAVRRSRRHRKTRYRWSHTARLARCYPSKTEAFRAWRRLCAPPRFNNRKRPKRGVIDVSPSKPSAQGWLPPSLMSRVYNIETWVARLRKLCPITALSLELVRFDTQAMVNPEISGIEYQR